MSDAMALARFNHHPDASTDFCMEVEMLDNWISDIAFGLRSQWPFWGRLSALLGFLKTDAACRDDIAQRSVPLALALEGKATGWGERASEE